MTTTITKGACSKNVTRVFAVNEQLELFFVLGRRKHTVDHGPDSIGYFPEHGAVFDDRETPGWVLFASESKPTCVENFPDISIGYQCLLESADASSSPG